MEIWKDLTDYYGIYQVSNFGNVKSLDRVSFNKKGYYYNSKGLILKQRTDINGYKVVGLCKDGKTKQYRVHQLVAICFYDFKSNRKINVDHIDNVKTNNKLSNLQLISARQNTSKDKVNKTGFTGVYEFKKNKSFYCQIRINGKRIFLGHSKDKFYLKSLYEKAITHTHFFDGDTKKFRKKLICVV